MKDAIEDIVTFKEHTDMCIISANNPDTQESIMEITGYDLAVKFNMSLIDSEEDIDRVLKTAVECFKSVLVQQLIDKTKN